MGSGPIHSTPPPWRTHNYTGRQGLLTSPSGPAKSVLGSNRGTPLPQRAAHYSDQATAVNHYFKSFFRASGPPFPGWQAAEPSLVFLALKTASKPRSGRSRPRPRPPIGSARFGRSGGLAAAVCASGEPPLAGPIGVPGRPVAAETCCRAVPSAYGYPGEAPFTNLVHVG